MISIPAAAVIAKLLLPETEVPETIKAVPQEDESTRAGNLMSAIIAGTMDGLKLAAGIAALLIAILGLVALFDRALLWPSQWFGLAEPLSLVKILGWVFYPFAALLGIARADLMEAGRLLGERVILTEVVSYQDLAGMISSGQLTDPRTAVILSYALCGFAQRRFGGDFRWRHGGTGAFAARRFGGAGLAGAAGGDLGNADDRVCGGHFQQRPGSDFEYRSMIDCPEPHRLRNAYIGFEYVLCERPHAGSDANPALVIRSP